MKYWFKNDYSFGAHPRVLDAVIKANLEGNTGYGDDKYSKKAKDIIRKKCGLDDAVVEFMVGGTQTNVVACAFLLKPWEAVVSAHTGHINGHEAGALEATGHKILQLEAGSDGKLTPELIKPLIEEHEDKHLTKPKLVYISDSTENGDVYTYHELLKLSEFCRKNDLYLFVDGARLGCALTSDKNDMTLAQFAKLVDAFYIGGTKNGSLFGEALVITKKELGKEFFRMKKRMGAVIEKGWIQGTMFIELLKDDLYFDMGRHSNEMAKKLQDGIEKCGFQIWVKSPTNQIFVIVPDNIKEKIEEICECETWCRYDDENTVMRFVTCFNTTSEDVDGFLNELKKINTKKM